MSEKMPVPLSLVGAPPPRYCPVCRKVTYSRAGIHPQCAQQEAERPWLEPIQKKQKTVTAAIKAANAADPLRPWHKRCPACLQQLPGISMRCRCGYRFPKRPDSWRRRYYRRCPHCRSVVHVRRVTCYCGYRLQKGSPGRPRTIKVKVVLRHCPQCRAELPKSQLTCGCGYQFNPNSLLPHIGFHKYCPQCLAQVPVNHPVCECGHRFEGRFEWQGFHKRCPGCQAQIPINRSSCACGHLFTNISQRALKRFHKYCPQCRAQVHGRAPTCRDCGYAFGNNGRAHLKGFHRRCPACQAQVHIGKEICRCGHQFQKMK